MSSVGKYFGAENLVQAGRDSVSALSAPGSPCQASLNVATAARRYETTVTTCTPTELFSLQYSELDALLVSLGVVMSVDGRVTNTVDVAVPPSPSALQLPPAARLSTAAASVVDGIASPRTPLRKKSDVERNALLTSPVASGLPPTTPARAAEARGTGAVGTSTAGTAASFRLEDLTRLRVLGVGAFGRVFLVRHEPSGKPYALKEMDKRRLVLCKQHNNVISEKRVLEQVTPCVVPRVVPRVATCRRSASLQDVHAGLTHPVMHDAGLPPLPAEPREHVPRRQEAVHAHGACAGRRALLGAVATRQDQARRCQVLRRVCAVGAGASASRYDCVLHAVVSWRWCSAGAAAACSPYPSRRASPGLRCNVCSRAQLASCTAI